MSSDKELWAVVEVMGHARYAGRVSEHSELGVPLVRVEVPGVEGRAPFEKLLGAAAIFRITPCTKEAAVEAARRFHVRPLAVIGLPARQPGLPLDGDHADADDAFDFDEYG